jgi:hypothetical protein
MSMATTNASTWRGPIATPGYPSRRPLSVPVYDAFPASLLVLSRMVLNPEERYEIASSTTLASDFPAPAAGELYTLLVGLTTERPRADALEIRALVSERAPHLEHIVNRAIVDVPSVVLDVTTIESDLVALRGGTPCPPPPPLGRFTRLYPALERWRQSVLAPRYNAVPLERAAAWELSALIAKRERRLGDWARARLMARTVLLEAARGTVGAV